jgi:SAM-dependent methyltransferase
MCSEDLEFTQELRQLICVISGYGARKMTDKEDDNGLYEDSEMASVYSQCRPTYPEKLFRYLAERTPQQCVAVDCGTGNGQAARALGKFFARVVAIDTSEQQLSKARPDNNVEYLLGTADQIPLPKHSVDLVTAAQTVHWFSEDPFYHEVERVLRRGGVLAVWCYLLPSISNGVDRAIHTLFQDERLHRHWPRWIRLVEQGYSNLPCFQGKSWDPFLFEARADRELDSLLQWIDTRVATRLAQKRGDSAAEARLRAGKKQIAEEWGQEKSVKTVRWKISGQMVIASE